MSELLALVIYRADQYKNALYKMIKNLIDWVSKRMLGSRHVSGSLWALVLKKRKFPSIKTSPLLFTTNSRMEIHCL